MTHDFLVNNLARKPKRVCLECTATLFSGYQTGIQRVVKNVILRCEGLSKFFGLPIIPVVFAFGKIWTFSAVESNFLKIQKINKIKIKIEYVITRLSFYFLHLESLTSPKGTGKTNGIFKKSFNFFKNLARNFFTAILFSLVKFRPVDLTKEDLLLAIDIFWDYCVIHHLTQLWQKGISIIPLIYDIFPIHYPEFFEENVIKEFNYSFYRLIEISCGIIGNSKTTIEELIRLIIKRGLLLENINLDYFYPGSDFKRIDSDLQKKDRIRGWLKKIWKSREVYLMVGTIEPRKNYGFVLDAFERMWEKGMDLNLLIIGRIGWKCEKLLERLKNSSYREKKLFVYHDVNDEELLYCYQKASALILASYAEGFGLPMIEAMRFGLPVLASDIEVFREIGGDYPIYFSLNSIDSLIEALHQVPKTIKNPKEWISWDESAKTLVHKALSIYSRQKDKKGIINI